MTNTTTINAVAEAWRPSAYVLRKYAEDMDTNTRLIDADIAPYLRKVAAWVEAYEQASVKEMTVEEVAEVIHNNYWADDYEDAPMFEKETARQQAKALAKLGTIRITGGGQ